MYVYLSVGTLILVPFVMRILRMVRPGFAYHWLLAVSGTILAWLSLLALGFQLPQTLSLGTWIPEDIFINSPGLLVDRFSWPFAFGLGTILLATMLTEVVRAVNANWSVWATSLALTALGLCGVLSANLLTLLLVWTALDLVELVLLFGIEGQPEARRGAVHIFSVRIIGSIGIFGASLFTPASAGFDLSSTPSAALLVLLGALLRLGVLPVASPSLSDRSLRLTLGTIARLTSTATALMLVVRISGFAPAGGIPALASLGLMTLFGLVAIYASASWMLAQDELDGRPAWILGFAMFSMASSLRGDPEASMVWALACMYAGSLAFLSSRRDRISRWISVLGMLGISALPFTPVWSGLTPFIQPFEPVLVLFPLALVLFLAGYYRHSFRTAGFRLEGERWIQVIYPIGLASLPLAHFGLIYYLNLIPPDPSMLRWTVGPIILVLAGGWVFWERRGGRFPLSVIYALDAVFSLRWLTRLLALIYRHLGGLFDFLTRVLEGDGGVLWALLSVVLLLAFLVIAR